MKSRKVCVIDIDTTKIAKFIIGTVWRNVNEVSAAKRIAAIRFM